ncbi:MAG: hypothetical protein ACLTYN_02450 [Dysosmobacter welbionis]
MYVNEGDSVSAGTQLLKIVADENITSTSTSPTRTAATSTSARPPRSLSTALPGPSPERLPRCPVPPRRSPPAYP